MLRSSDTYVKKGIQLCKVKYNAVGGPQWCVLFQVIEIINEKNTGNETIFDYSLKV